MVSSSLPSDVFHSYRITSLGHAHAADVVLYQIQVYPPSTLMRVRVSVFLASINPSLTYIMFEPVV